MTGHQAEPPPAALAPHRPAVHTELCLATEMRDICHRSLSEGCRFPLLCTSSFLWKPRSPPLQSSDVSGVLTLEEVTHGAGPTVIVGVADTPGLSAFDGATGQSGEFGARPAGTEPLSCCRHSPQQGDFCAALGRRKGPACTGEAAAQGGADLWLPPL